MTIVTKTSSIKYFCDLSSEKMNALIFHRLRLYLLSSNIPSVFIKKGLSFLNLRELGRNALPSARKDIQKDLTMKLVEVRP